MTGIEQNWDWLSHLCDISHHKQYIILNEFFQNLSRIVK